MTISEKLKKIKEKGKTAALGVTLAATSMFSTGVYAQNNSDNDSLKAKIENTNQESMLLSKFLDKADKVRKDALANGTASYDMIGGDSYELMYFNYKGSENSKCSLSHIPYYENGAISNVEGGEYHLNAGDGVDITINRNGVYKYVFGQESLDSTPISGKEAVQYLALANDELNAFSGLADVLHNKKITDKDRIKAKSLFIKIFSRILRLIEVGDELSIRCNKAIH